MTPVDLGAGALAALAPVSMLCGVGAWIAFRRWSDRAAIRRSINLIAAHLLEFRLFLDEPRIILRAQWSLIVENGRLLRLLLKPAVIVTLPTLLLITQLEALYGRAALVPGEPVLVTLRGGDWGAENPPTALLRAPLGIAVETPGVRAVAVHEIAWRIRPSRDVSGALRAECGNTILMERVVAGRGVHYISRTWADPMDIDYPPAAIMGLDWAVWFFLFSAAGALLFAILETKRNAARPK